MLFVPRNSNMEQPAKLAEKLHFPVDIQKTIKSNLLVSQSYHFLKLSNSTVPN